MGVMGAAYYQLANSLLTGDLLTGYIWLIKQGLRVSIIK